MAVIELDSNNFDQVIQDNDIVLIDFWASWCGPCQIFAPVYEAVAERHPDIVFAKVNTEAEQALAAHFGIRSIPTLMLFRERIILFQQAGVLPESALEEVVAKSREIDMAHVRQEVAAQQQAQGSA